MSTITTIAESLIRDILRRLQRVERTSPTTGDNADDPIHQAPEVYIVKTPKGGIPKLKGKRPGRAWCNVYQHVAIAPGSVITDLEPVTYPDGSPLRKLVYNISIEKVSAKYIEISRDKFGRWNVDCPCGTVIGSSSSESSSGSDSSSSSDASSSNASSSNASSSNASSSNASSSNVSSSADQSSSQSTSGSIDYDDPPNGLCICTWNECCYGRTPYSWLSSENPPCGTNSFGYPEHSVWKWRCYLGGGGPICEITGICHYNMAPGGFEGESRGTPFPCCG